MSPSPIRINLSPFSSQARPALAGSLGAVAAAHPLAVSGAQRILAEGGNAVDATIAAQAVIAVVMPDAAGLGGDGFFLVREGNGKVTAVNGAGRSAQGPVQAGLGASITVPGLVDAWGELSRRWGRLPLSRALQPAIHAARRGFQIYKGLAQAVDTQRQRLLTAGAARWSLLRLKEGEHWEQPELAATLDQIAKSGSSYFYRGALPIHMCAAAARAGHFLTPQAFLEHAGLVGEPLSLPWRGMRVHVSPPVSQGVLLLMALQAFDRMETLDAMVRDHALVELVGSVFLQRHRVCQAEAIMALEHPIDFDHASGQKSARSYLHTAGVCCSDDGGMTVSSLISVFDDFGSGAYVPEGGFVLNNRGDGFTQAPNDYAPDKAPIHTLAPIMVTDANLCLGMSTPGADGQVQTLLQVLCGCVEEKLDLAAAIHRPRWRSEDGKLLVEGGHPSISTLQAKGHKLQPMAIGDMRAGAVMAAGQWLNTPFAVADWRRLGWSGVV